MSVFTPSPKISAEGNPRDWAYELGCLPQTASIVFTKASLIAFLKTHGIEVGPNYSEINKLPKYALVGQMTEEPVSARSAPDAAQKAVKTAASPAPFTAPRQAPLAISAPSAPPSARELPAKTQLKSGEEEEQEVRTPDGHVFRPTRRVREPIGGGSAQIGALFGGGSDEHEEAVKEAEREQAKRRGLSVEKPVVKAVPQQPLSVIENDQQGESGSKEKASDAFRPTRRVR